MITTVTFLKNAKLILVVHLLLVIANILQCLNMFNPFSYCHDFYGAEFYGLDLNFCSMFGDRNKRNFYKGFIEFKYNSRA